MTSRLILIVSLVKRRLSQYFYFRFSLGLKYRRWARARARSSTYEARGKCFIIRLKLKTHWSIRSRSRSNLLPVRLKEVFQRLRERSRPALAEKLIPQWFYFSSRAHTPRHRSTAIFERIQVVSAGYILRGQFSLYTKTLHDQLVVATGERLFAPGEFNSSTSSLILINTRSTSNYESVSDLIMTSLFLLTSPTLRAPAGRFH
ncbi:hypothetical protein EVAR_13845_1 [Eumeta japonica]|uniref:Uncharacterized protein n=1 Tax=Eumeta variegata TaxID=151549 RepID=A0A4C1U131_EUMVA|nr:hypothetical protein EVAR_13845_1 [Eumeta japonica]